MSSISFDALYEDRPDLRRAVARFSDWGDAHPEKKIIDPRALARYLKDVPAGELIAVCRELVARGSLRQRYALERPSGQLSGTVYLSPAEIPAEIPGDFETWISSSDATVVPVFTRAERDDG
jgi:hypothetical protein